MYIIFLIYIAYIEQSILGIPRKRVNYVRKTN